MDEAFDEMTTRLNNSTEVREIAEGGAWPVFAIAAALIDKGIIEKEKLLAITSDLIEVAFVDHSSNTAIPLIIFRDLLKDQNLTKDTIAKELSDAAKRAAEKRDSNPQTQKKMN